MLALRRPVRSSLRWSVALVAIALPATRISPQASGTEPLLAIEGATVVDVERGVLLRDHTLLVRGNRIEAVGPSRTTRVDARAERIDARGQFVVPGLWDMHVHFPQNDTLRGMFLRFGVTGVREMGSEGASVATTRLIRDSIVRGTWTGPRIVTSIHYIDGQRGYTRAGTTLNPVGPDDAVAAVDSLAAVRADFIKILGEVPGPVFDAVTAAARTHGLRVAGHWPADVTFDQLVRGRPASIEHMFWATTQCAFSTAARCANRGAILSAEQIAVAGPALADAGIWMTPTLVNQRRRAYRDTVFHADPRLALIPSRIAQRWRTDTTLHRPLPPIVRSTYDREVGTIPALRGAGVTFLAGTDGPAEYLYPGSSLHDELVLLTEAGLTPLEALRSATSGPAAFLGTADSLGTVTPGKLADLVFLDADPLADIRNVRRIRAVMMNGRWIRRL